MKHSIKRVAAASLLACIGFAATAQPAPPAPPPGHGMQHGDPAKMQERMQQRVAKHMADLKVLLRITPAQESAWTAFTGSMRPPVAMGMRRSPEEREKMRAEMDKLSTPERMDRMRALRTERHTKMSAEMDRMGAAVKSFYAVLSPEQQKVFDIEHKRMQERRMHGMGRMHGGPGMH